MNFFRPPKISNIRLTSRSYHSAGDGIYPSQVLLNLLDSANLLKSPHLIRQCHGRIFTVGFTQNPFLATKLISVYASCGLPNESHLVFDSFLDRSVFLWNALINGYVKNQAYEQSFGLFREMCRGSVFPDAYTLATMSKLYGEFGDLNSGRMIHGKIMRIGFVWDTVVANSLMSMYCKCTWFGECLKVFDEMPLRSVGSWNVVISGYASLGDGTFVKEMSKVVKTMENDGLKPDAFTVSSLLPLCHDVSCSVDYGRELHGYILRHELGSGMGSDVHLGCCLVDMYARSNRVGVGRRVFDQTKNRNVHAWTAIINGYMLTGKVEEALSLLRQMQIRDRLEPNSVTLLSVLPACGSLAGSLFGRQVHGYSVRKELSSDVALRNALIDMYSKCGSLNYARRVFDDVSFIKDAISWSSLISGYGLHGKGEEAICLYNKMLHQGSKPDTIIVVGVLSACGRSGLVNEGLHLYYSAVHNYGLKPTVEVCACVVDMLGRSGQLGEALDFIKKMPIEPGPSVWGALVSASTMHGNYQMQDLAYRCLAHLEPENPSNYISLSNLHASSKRWHDVAAVRTMMKERGLQKTPGCSWISLGNRTHSFFVADKVHPSREPIHEMLKSLILVMKEAPDSPTIEDVT
ncbi:Putative pentatricopeptide repeat-containing protein At3g23330 [Linum perenne]